MEPKKQITAAVFSAFVKCPTKAYLLAVGEPLPDTYFSAFVERISSTYKSVAKRQLLSGREADDLCNFVDLWSDRKSKTATRYVDCETAVYDLARTDSIADYNSKLSNAIIPLLFVPWEKPDECHSLLACFGALALSQLCRAAPNDGAFIFGDSYRRRTVKIANRVARTRQIIDAIAAAWREQKPPTLILNQHCVVCDFQQRCRGMALERDDLSLLTGMTAKDRAKCAAKGIFTITQLSYGYRPRRRRRNRLDAERSKKSARRTASQAKNDFKLKALAIKKNQIHVVGAPSLNFEGVPTFLDVEGMPDRDFYYLIGLRFKRDGVFVERWFWADRSDGEPEIWKNCLRTLKEIEKPQIVSYGAYETRFLRQMKERYGHEPGEVEFVDQLIKTSVNLVSRIYGRIYFPTHSNSLKEVARYLGFEWTWARASGAAALLLRRAWELSAGRRTQAQPDPLQHE